MWFVHGERLAGLARLSSCYRSAEETILSSAENNPSWLLPLLPSRATGALLALLYLHPTRTTPLLRRGD
jgi:hypothetical protein